MSSLSTSASAITVNEGFPGNFFIQLDFFLLSNWKIYLISIGDKVCFFIRVPQIIINYSVLYCNWVITLKTNNFINSWKKSRMWVELVNYNKFTIVN